MAISTNSPEKTLSEHQTSTQQPAPDNPNPSISDLPNSSAAPPATIPANATIPPPAAVNPNPNSNTSQPSPQIQSFVPPTHPSFRPASLPLPLPTAPQFSPIPNPSFQNHGIPGQVQVQVQPPGVIVHPPSQSTGAVPQMMPPPPHYGQQPMRMYAPLPNGYQMAVPQGTMNPPVCYRSMSW